MRRILVFTASLVSVALNSDNSISGRLLSYASSGGAPAGRDTILPGQPSRRFVPRTIALLVILLAFIFAGWRHARDASCYMIPTLIVARRGGWVPYLVSTVLLSVWLSVLLGILMLIGLRPLFGITLKPEFGLVTIAMCAGCTVSAILGLSSGLIVSGEKRTLASAAIYFLFLMLTSGFVVPISASSVGMHLLSFLSPLRFVHESLEYWLFLGLPPYGPSLLVLAGQFCVSVAVLYCAARVARGAM